MLQLSPRASPTSGPALQTADERDWVAVLRLLDAAGLPTADLLAAHVEDFIVARADDRVVGAVAVERHGLHGLLRSLVVDPAWRGRGLGGQLLVAAERHARAAGLHSLTLLTQSAAAVFAAHGYVVIDRATAPAALHATPQFAALCPSTSTCMTKTLVPARP
jgi:N-acetylglutamate synthase-like GNAT family acetyltransferase